MEILVVIYVIVAAAAFGKTLAECYFLGARRHLDAALGMLACGFWPLTFGFMLTHLWFLTRRRITTHA
jgi:Na+-translocating ferredoxin:NAD+ oxidoreductase RnfA subunit